MTRTAPPLIFLSDLCDCRCHQGLAETDNVGQQYPTAGVKMMRREGDGSCLEVQELLLEQLRQLELLLALTRLRRQVVNHLQIDEVWGNQVFSGPTRFDPVG